MRVKGDSYGELLTRASLALLQDVCCVCGVCVCTVLGSALVASTVDRDVRLLSFVR